MSVCVHACVCERERERERERIGWGWGGRGRRQTLRPGPEFMKGLQDIWTTKPIVPIAMGR